MERFPLPSFVGHLSYVIYFPPISCVGLIRDRVFRCMAMSRFSALMSKYVASEVTTCAAFQSIEQTLISHHLVLGTLASVHHQRKTRSPATAEIARDADERAIQGHSGSSVVVPIDAAYDFLLALSSNM